MKISNINDKPKTKNKWLKYFKYGFITLVLLPSFFIYFVVAYHYFSYSKVRSEAHLIFERFVTPANYELNLINILDIAKYNIKSLFTDVDIIYLNTDFKNSNKYFYQLAEEATDDNKFNNSKGKLLLNNEKVDVNFKPKGDRDLHYRKNKPSLRVKVKNGETILGMSEFSLQDPLIRNYLSEYLWLKMLKEQDIIVPNYGFVQLIFNAKDYGIYSFEEKLTTIMLERLGYKNSSIMKFREDFSTDLKDYPEIDVINSKKVPLKNMELATGLLRSFIHENNNIENVFDLEKLATFFAITDLLQSHHGVVTKSLRFYYNPYTNLLEPIPFDGHSPSTYGKFILSYDLSCENDTWMNKDKMVFELFFNINNKIFLKKYFEKLVLFSSISYIDSIKQNDLLTKELEHSMSIIYKDFPLEDRSFYEGPYPYYFNFIDELENNSLNIRNKLDKINIQSFLKAKDEKDFTVTIFNFSKEPYPIKLKSINSENFKFNISDSLVLFNKVYEKPLIKGENIFVNNDSLIEDVRINKKLVLEYESMSGKLYKKSINLFPFTQDVLDVNNDYLKQLLLQKILTNSNDTLSCNIENLVLEDVLVIPENYLLKVEAGQKISFNDNAGIVSYGQMYFNGSVDNPIQINSYNKNEKNGFLLCINNKYNYFGYVYVNGLSTYHKLDISGSLTFYNSKVIMENCNFENNNSEDYLNFVHSEVKISNIVMTDVFSDCIDFDFSYGEISNLSIKLAKNDGLDFSGSQVVVKNATFSKVGDKAISAGEESTLKLLNISILDSELGITSKDGSTVVGEVIDNIDVKVPIVLFKKKNRYPSPTLTLTQFTSNGESSKYIIQKKMNANINNNKLEGDITDVESMLYGKVYGKKTVK